MTEPLEISPHFAKCDEFQRALAHKKLAQSGSCICAQVAVVREYRSYKKMMKLKRMKGRV